MAVRGDGRPGSVTLLAASGKRRRHRRPGFARCTKIPELRSAPQAGTLPEAVAREAPVAAGRDEIAIALVGAHMSGLPLNAEITGRGGRFLFAGATSPEYRFYALAGGPPHRPGLVRQVEDGASIALEVWALPKTAFGAFMAGIPAPLGIGTLALSDGGTVKGFICEAAGVEGAEDITAFGGWRAFLEATS